MSNIFTRSTPSWAYGILSQASKKYNIPTSILSSLIEHESSWNPKAISSAGAVGLGQFMPATAKSLGIDPSNPQQAIMGAAQYLRQQMDQFGGDLQKGLAAYNAGAGAVRQYNGIPPYRETQNYVAGIINSAKQIDPTYLQAAQSVTPTPNYGGVDTSGMSDAQKALLRNIIDLPTPSQPDDQSESERQYQQNMLALDKAEKQLAPAYTKAVTTSNLIHDYLAGKFNFPGGPHNIDLTPTTKTPSAIPAVSQPSSAQQGNIAMQQQPFQPKLPSNSFAFGLTQGNPSYQSQQDTTNNPLDPRSKKKKVPTPFVHYLQQGGVV